MRACHTAGALGAPKLGDAGAWAARIKAGFDALIHSALAGKGQMPPQGGGDFSDYEIARAVVFMTNKAGAKLRRAGAAGRDAADHDRRRRRQDRRARGTATAGGAPMADANAGKPTATPRRAQRPGRDAPRSRSGRRTQVAANAAAAATTTRRRRGSAPALRPGSARPAMPPASPARPSSATRPPGHRAWRKASTS